MAIIRTNFIAGKMNKSVDERLVPKGQYVDALNVRLGSTEGTEIGAVENSKGNTLLTDLEFRGTKLNQVPATVRTIGAYEDSMKETLYWFVHAENVPNSPTGIVDMICSYETTAGLLTYHVISISTLNFDKEFLITGVNKIEEYLYFTDDLNPPRYINVERNYPQPVGATDGIEEEDISVILKPPGFEDGTGVSPFPLPTPDVKLIEIPGGENYLENKFVCFAYRYKYTDGSYSATSLFSNPAFQPKAFQFDISTFSNISMTNKFNAAEITFSTGSKRVISIDLLYKDTNSNIIYVIERYNKEKFGWPDNTQQTITFDNAKIYTTLGSDELLRLYDNVPRTAKAQTIQGNRLMYGNYVDGYNLVDLAGNKILVDYFVEPVHQVIGGEGLAEPTTSTGSNYSISGVSQSVPNSEITFDLSAYGTDPVEPGTTFNFSVQMSSSGTVVSGQGSNGSGDPGCLVPGYQNVSPFSLDWTFTATTQYANVSTMIASAEFAYPIGITGPGNATGQFKEIDQASTGGTLTDKFNANIVAPAVVAGWCHVNTAITNTCIPTNCPPSSGCSPQGFSLSFVGNTFTLKAPAVQYYNPTCSPVANQYEYFEFSGFGSASGYLRSDNTLSLHSDRDYEVGVVYMDEYARATTVVVSEENTVFIPAEYSTAKNSVKVTLKSLPPAWAKKYKFVMKPSKGDYNMVYSNLFFQSQDESSIFYFKLEGDNTNIVQKGMKLFCKLDTLGPRPITTEVTVLDVIAAGKEDADYPVVGNLLQAGLYMVLKPNFSTEILDGAFINYGRLTKVNEKRNCDNGKPSVKYSLNDTSDPNSGTPYTLPAGSQVRININIWRGGSGNRCRAKHYRLDEVYTASTDYNDFFEFFYGDGIDQLIGNGSSNGITLNAPNNGGAPFTSSSQTPKGTCFTAHFCIVQPSAGSHMFVRLNGDLKECANFWGDQRPGHTELTIEVTRAGNLVAFETDPGPVDENLYYDASEMMDIELEPTSGQLIHKSSGGAGDIDQSISTGTDLVQNLKFGNCFTFANGIESFRIQDRADGKSFNLGQRTLAVSNQEVQEADRFAGMTYSGVFSGPSNVNNLNEFNLGLANFKDLETSFGPIMKMHSRETDILVLQEDRISYVLSGKNVVTDSTGGGAITSVPEVLGTQIARIEEYGMGFQPESFADWGSQIYFTDTKRGAVVLLKGTSANTDSIEIVSSYGMRSFFRDEFRKGIHTQKLGGYDPYMDEYVLSANIRPVPVPEVIVPCGQRLSQLDTTTTFSYKVDVGLVIGQIDIPYQVTSGGINITAVWNGNSVTTGNVTNSGTLSINKTANNPQTIDVTIAPVNTATYEVTVNCPPEPEITVVEIVINSNNFASQSTHLGYQWTDGITISPSSNNAVVLADTVNQPALWQSNTGVRSVGLFPYDGVDITMRNQKIIPDNFDFDPTQHKFKYLSSNTLYTPSLTNAIVITNSATEITPITNPTTNTFQAKATSVSLPIGNQYLYLVWDYRDVTESLVCYSNVSLDDVCCDCNPNCTQAYFGPVEGDFETACATNTNSNGFSLNSFTGSPGTIPVIGDVVFNGTACDTNNYLAPGYYVVDPSQPAALSPKNYVRIGNNGAVIETGTC